MIITNKQELLRAIWKNWQDSRPEKGEERDKLRPPFIWEYMKNACQNEADRLCKMEMTEIRGMLELPGGIEAKGSGKTRTKKYSRLLMLEQLRSSGIISEEEFYHGLEKIKKGITSKLAKKPEDEEVILKNLEFSLLRKVVEDFFTNNGFKLADPGYADGIVKDEGIGAFGGRESIYEDIIWLYTEFRHNTGNSESRNSGVVNKAGDENYIRECEAFYQLLNQSNDSEIQSTIKQLYLPICIDPDNGMGVYLIGKELYSPPEHSGSKNKMKTGREEKIERLCTVCLLKFFSLERIPGMDSLLSVCCSVIPYRKVREAMVAFRMECDREEQFLDYAEMNVCSKPLPSVPDSLLPYFSVLEEMTTAEIEMQKEEDAIAALKKQDKDRREWRKKHP